MSTRLLVLALAPVGACLGSYAGTAGIRWARAEPSVQGRSHCDACGVMLGFARTAPIVSYVVLRGRCGACGDPIDRTHIVAEAGGALVLVSAFALAPPLRATLLSGLGLLLLATSIVDARTRRLPDALTLAIALIGLILAAQTSLRAFVTGCVVGAAAFVILASVRWGFQLARGRDGLGFGDVKLIAALAVWLGFATPWAVVGAAMLALGVVAALRPADDRTPFGPMIAAASWIVGLGVEAGVLHP